MGCDVRLCERSAKVFGLALDAGDHEIIEAVLANGRDLINLIGDCGDEYR